MSNLSYAVRQLVDSNLSWFLESRNTLGERAGRERAININKVVFNEWFPALTESERNAKRVDVQCRYYSAIGVTVHIPPPIRTKNQGFQAFFWGGSE